MLACSAMVACTSEDPIDNGSENPAAKSDKAYLAVKLVDANNTSSRGAGDETNPFHYGAADENAVNSVEFYFYYDGVYETYSNDVDFSWTTNGTDAAGDKTIEKYSNAVVVLSGLSEQNQKAVLPNGVLCVINAPENYTDGTTTYEDLTGLDYDKAMSVIHNHYATAVTSEGTSTNYFIMTNSAFQGATGSGLYVPQSSFGNYLAPIAQENFELEDPEYDDDGNLVGVDPVEICVERLAAKVEVDLATNSLITAAGMALGAPVEFRNITIDEKGKATTTFENKQLYLKVLGWGLNGTNKNNYAIKNIDTSWSFGAFTWNDAAYNRSYWAMSPNYGKGSYPVNFAGAYKEATDKTDVEGTDKTDASIYTLNYFSWNELNGTLGAHAYCMENTNKDAILKANFASSLTNVLVKAQVYVQTTSNDGESTTEDTNFSFVRYNNTFYTPESFLAQVWNQVNLQYYYKKADNTYALWTPDHLTEVNIFDGKVNVALKSDAPTEWFTRVANTEGGYTYTAVETPQISSRLKGLAIEAEYFNDGMMYYAIPVEHLRGGKYGFDENGAVTLNEADYGIVRNHYYNIALKSISKLGTSVYDPNEDIIVQIVDNKTYAIAAQINILSWKVVNQGVDL